VGSRMSNRPLRARSLTGVVGVARRHRALRNTGGPFVARVATLASPSARGDDGRRRGTQYRLHLPDNELAGGKAPWFGVRFNESRGRRLA